MRKILWIVAIWYLVLIGLTVWADFAHAHDDAIVKCDRNLPVESVTKLGEDTLENGLLAESYDRNADGKADILAYSSILYGGLPDEAGLVPHSAFPVVWQVDLDFDGYIDAVYQDVGGQGRCDEIKLTLDLNKPLPDGYGTVQDPTLPEWTDVLPNHP